MSHPPTHTPHTLPLPWLPSTRSSRTLSADFLLCWVIAASEYPIIASSVFHSLSPPLSGLYRELIPEHLVFCTSVRQWPSWMFFFNPRGPSTSRGSNICSGETQLAARGSRSSLYLRVAEANQNESLSLSLSPTLQTHPPNTHRQARGDGCSHTVVSTPPAQTELWLSLLTESHRVLRVVLLINFFFLRVRENTILTEMTGYAHCCKPHEYRLPGLS